MKVAKIISGGQTGVDRAALDVALELGIPHGGWVPRGRRAEDGRIPDRYQLQETPGRDYQERTERNILDASGTLILSFDDLSGGSLLTWDLCGEYRLSRPRFHVYLNTPTAERAADIERVRDWLWMLAIAVDDVSPTVNVAGPRESKAPGIHAAAMAFLREVLAP